MNRNIDKLGRIVIPKEMRKEIGLKNGDEVKIEVHDSKIIVSNPNQGDPFGDWLCDYILRTESVEAKTILIKYQELKK